MTANPKKPKVIIVMGVAGSGKTTVGKLLAEKLHWTFEDADDFHSAANVEKMSAGLALTDEDRNPWLETLRASIKQHLDQGQSMVLACSALKESYRAALQLNDSVCVVYLKGTFELFNERLRNRKGHFMKSKMLQSQFLALEEPVAAIVEDAALSPNEIAENVYQQLKPRVC